MMTLKQNVKCQNTLTSAHKNYEKGLNRYAFFKMNDRGQGEDLVQETFLKTWSYLARGKKIDLMKAFLYHILNNLIIDEYKKRKNKTSSLDILIERGFEPSSQDSSHIFDIIDGKSALLLIKHLPLIYRKSMTMRYVNNLSLKEMSLVTGQTKNAIAVQIYRGLEKLRLLYRPA